MSLDADLNRATDRTGQVRRLPWREVSAARVNGTASIPLLEDVLGITPEAQAAKTNLWYPQDAPAALAKLRGGGEGAGDVLFLMPATPVADVRAVAEAGHVMPQKSTFFYPKVLTGLAIHTLDPSRRVALG